MGVTSNKVRLSLTMSISILLLLYTGCKDGIINPINDNGVLCYEKLVNGYWEIFTNNISGTNPQNISNYPDDDEYPQWSPDGRYIVYSRSQPAEGLLIIVYDTKTQTGNDISDGGEASLKPQWTPNGKVFFGYSHPWGKYHGTFLMNSDGSDRKKILDTTATIYFYNDSYEFLYIINYVQVYRSNIDNTINEYLFDISQELNQQVVVQDFNPLTNELLISPAIDSSKDAVATFNVNSKSLNILLNGEQGYNIYQVKYSNDYSKIGFIEHSNNDEYLSVLENGEKKRLVRIASSNPPVFFSYTPIEFSPDGRYIAFSKEIFHSGNWVSFSTPLLIVDINTGIVHLLEDEAHGPSWNPRP